MKFFELDGCRASRVVQGCMRISGLDQDALDRLIRSDLEQGINFFDHADIYGGGECERKFGQVLRADPALRDQMWIQTKCGIRRGWFDFSKEHILASAEAALERLQTDHIDFLLLHRPDTLCEPEEVADVRGQVTSDYQNLLEEEWIEELKSKYPIVVYEKVLKKVK